MIIDLTNTKDVAKELVQHCTSSEIEALYNECLLALYDSRSFHTTTSTMLQSQFGWPYKTYNVRLD